MTKNDRIKKRVADAIRAAFGRSVATMKGARLKDLIAAIEARNIDAAIRVLGIDRTSLAELETEINKAYYTGAELVVGKVGFVETSVGSVQFKFDYRSEAAERWIRDYSSTLIQQISNEQRDMVKAFLEREMIKGSNPLQTALSIVGRVDPATGARTGGIVGLLPSQQAWVDNARAELLTLDPNYLTRELRDRRFDSMVKKAINDGTPLTQDQINTAIARMEARALKYRGDTIARTESVTALRAGQHEAITQAVEVGEIDAQDVRKVWDSTGDDGRTRESHLQADGDEVGVDEPFTIGDSQMMYPGDTSLGASPEETINCRCRVSYKIDFIGKGVRMEAL